MFEDFPQNMRATDALSCCVQLEEKLINSCGETGLRGKLTRWLQDTSLGTLSQMRVELEIRFNVEQLWISTDDNVNIDCLVIPVSSEAPTMLVCCPNSGFYEFAYYQNQWLEFFVNAGISVFLWNYRGYGRTRGRPSVARLKRDGECIVEYLRHVRKVGKLGFYGERLGGAIASHLARTMGADFLFVDRSFSSLDHVALFNFSKLAYYVFKCFYWKLEDFSLDFLRADCYKLLTVDPNDPSTHDLASVKTGAALNSLGLPHKLQGHYHLLNREESEHLLRSLKNLMKLIVQYIDRRGANSLLRPVSPSKSPSTIDLVDEETITNLLCRIFTVLDSLDAGGKPLSHIYMHKPRLFSLKLWLVVLDVYGSYLPLLPDEIGNSRNKSVAKLKESAEELERICKDHAVFSNPFVCYIIENTQHLLYHIFLIYNHYERCNYDKALQSEDSQIDLSAGPTSRFDPVKVGYLIPLSSTQGQVEKMQIEWHLANSLFSEN